MKSNWIPMKPNAAPQTDRSDLMRKIYELIDWYEDNSTRKEDDFIKAKLKSIIHLAENVENSEDIMFIEEIVQTFGDIIRKQRGIIRELEEESEFLPIGQDFSQLSFMTSHIAPGDGFANDEQIKARFTAHMQKPGKEKSPFTINDYILRIQNLWRVFYEDYEAGELPSELAESVIREEIQADSPLLNAYKYIEELNCYLSMKISGNSTNRNWLNVRAALNIFGEAMHGEEYEKVKVVREAAPSKDFSKYLFDGNSYGKSRLVLAIVTKYVKDRRPVTYDELEDAFPSRLQGSLGVVRRIEDVSDKYKGKGGVKRYFVNENEIINLESGERVIVCTQWGKSNTEALINHIDKYGYSITQI